MKEGLQKVLTDLESKDIEEKSLKGGGCVLQHSNRVLNAHFYDILVGFQQQQKNTKNIYKVIFSFEIQLFLRVPAS